MVLKPEDKEANNIIVMLDGRPIRYYVTANDKEGWIEIPDISTISPLSVLETKKIIINKKEKEVPSLFANEIQPNINLHIDKNKVTEDNPLQETSLKIKRKYGKVEFIYKKKYPYQSNV